MARPPSKSPEEKTRIVVSILREEITMAEAARRTGVSQTSIAKWRDRFLAGGQAALAAEDRHLEMEQDRTPYVRLHHHELAGPAPHLHTYHHRTHRRRRHQQRSHHPGRPRPNRIPQGRQDQRRRTCPIPLTAHDWHGDSNYTIHPT